MSIGFTGTQIGLSPRQKDTLKYVLSKLFVVDHSFRHGDCIGADAEAHQIALSLGFKIIIHPPIVQNKRAFCREADILPEKEYLDRNKDIVKYSKILIACPKMLQEEVRSGTWSTVRYARKFNKDIIVIYFDGTIQKEIRSV